MWPRESSCAALKQSSQREYHPDEENVTGGKSKMNLRTEVIHLEQKSKRRDILLQYHISLGVCAYVCVHTRAGRCWYTNPLWKFWNFLQKEEKETRVKILSVYWHASPNFFNDSYSQQGWEPKRGQRYLTPKTMSKYLFIIVQTFLPHGRYDFICNLKAILRSLTLHTVKDFLRLVMQAFHSFLFCLFYETNSHCESWNALELTV